MSYSTLYDNNCYLTQSVNGMNNTIVTLYEPSNKMKYNINQRMSVPQKFYQESQDMSVKAPKTSLRIAEGSMGLKFARIGRAINQLQDQVRCPFSQYYDSVTNKCLDYGDGEMLCPSGQRFDGIRCMTIESTNGESPNGESPNGESPDGGSTNGGSTNGGSPDGQF
jgi:hypothetical protein